MISRRALAPLSNDSGSKPDLLGSSGGGASDLVSEAGSGGEGELEGEEEKKGKRKEESAYARSESVDTEATAAATATQEVNLAAAMASECGFEMDHQRASFEARGSMRGASLNPSG